MNVLICRVCSLMLLLSALTTGAVAGFAADSFDVSFTGKPRAQETFRFGIRSSISMEYTMRIKGAEKAAKRTETIKVASTGELKLLKVNAAGNPLELEYTVNALAAELDGAAVNLSNLSGRTIYADLSQSAPVFRLLPKTGGEPDDFQAQVLGNSSPASAKKTEALSREALRALSVIFHPATGESLSDTLGAGGKTTAGQVWPLQLNRFIQRLEKRGIKLAPNDLKASAELEGRKTFEKLPVYAVSLGIQTLNLPGYDFRMTASVLVPCDPALGSSFRISRKVTEVVTRDLPSSDPLAAGSTMELISHDDTDLVMLPKAAWENANRPEERESGGFWRNLFRW